MHCLLTSSFVHGKTAVGSRPLLCCVLGQSSLQKVVVPFHSVLLAAVDGLAFVVVAVAAVTLRLLEHSWVLCLPFARY